MMLPNGWKKVKLGDCFDVQLGKMLNKNTREQEPQYPYLANVNVRWGSLNTEQLPTMYFSEREKEKFALKINDILMCEGGEIGRCTVLKEPLDNVFYQKACHRLRAKNNLCIPDYLYFYINNYVTSREIVGLVGESSIAHLPAEKVVQIQLNLPPLEEQKKIAATLSVWDSAIEKMEKLIKAKECGHAVLMNNMLKKAKTWDCNYLSDIATIKKGKQLNAVDMISDGAYYVMNGGITPSGNTDDWNTAENTISISEGGNSCGFVAFNKEKFWAGGHCYTLIDLSEVVSVKFLFHYLKNMEKEIMAMRVGSGLPNIQKDSISDIEVLYPSKKEQKRISEVLDDSLSEIALLKQQLENYKKQKQGLMQKLLTGQWRVK